MCQETLNYLTLFTFVFFANKIYLKNGLNNYITISYDALHFKTFNLVKKYGHPSIVFKMS